MTSSRSTHYVALVVLNARHRRGLVAKIACSADASVDDVSILCVLATNVLRTAWTLRGWSRLYVSYARGMPLQALSRGV